MSTSSSRADSGFAYTRTFFENLVDSALAHAKKLGATDVGAEASEGCGLSVSVRKGELENVERNRDKSLGVTVYVGHRRGNASTSDFSRPAIERTVQAAYDIARRNKRVKQMLQYQLVDPPGEWIWRTAVIDHNGRPQGAYAGLVRALAANRR